MSSTKQKKRIAIIGGGPSGLFAYKQLVRSGKKFEIHVFEKSGMLGGGMPYSPAGANAEHITNVSSNEIPELVSKIEDWIRTVPTSKLKDFDLDTDHFTKFKVLPRLLFGYYLADQFQFLRYEADRHGILTHIHYHTEVTDIADQPEEGTIRVTTGSSQMEFDNVVICTGHKWPAPHEGKVKGYFDSPYPPSKIQLKINHTVAVKGSSLTAIDAIRTLARHNGAFSWNEENKRVFTPGEDSPKFKIVMHSRSGLLPAIRFHLDKPRISGDSLLSEDEVRQNMKENGGFLSLDYVFDRNFKEGFKEKEPALYKRIKKMDLETFVKLVMDMREDKPPFQLFREEYREAKKSIEERESIYWKEMLADLSFSMNYPAKYFSAEDRLRLESFLMPLIATVIAFVPQSSCDELLALEEAGRLEIVSVGSNGTVEPQEAGGIIYKYTDEQGKKHRKKYQTYIDCAGQKHFDFEDFPFEGLLNRRTVSPAYLRFKSKEEGKKVQEEGKQEVMQNAVGDYFLKVPGVAINDCFQVVNEYGMANERLFIMAVPYIGGYNPDYSGLDFCEQASQYVMEKITENMV